MKKVLFFLLFLLSSCYDNNTLSQIEFKSEKYIKVSIQGHINKPGIYLIEKGSTIDKLIKKANGYKSNASKLKNEKLKNNKEYFINSNRIKNKINLNSASSTDLIKIKGIGPALAKKIIDYRLKINHFSTISQLMNIKGVKEKKFNKIYEYFSV